MPPRRSAPRPAAGRRAGPRALCALAGLALLAGCGAAGLPGAAAGGDGPAPLPSIAQAAPMPGAPEVLLLPASDGTMRGWIAPRPAGPGLPALPALPFIFDASDDAAREGAPPILFLGGDARGETPAAMTPRWRAQARAALDRAAAPGALLTLGRPFAGDPERWRTQAEIDALARALAVLGRAIGFGRVDALGHSSGAHLAVALAQQTGRIRHLAAAAPPLDLMAWHATQLGGAAVAVSRQYDPVTGVEGFAAERMALVADPLDGVAPPRAWQGWLQRALAAGKPVELLFARGGGADRHGLIGAGAEALAALRRGAPLPGAQAAAARAPASPAPGPAARGSEAPNPGAPDPGAPTASPPPSPR